MDEALEKIGGPYTYTTTSVLGDKRSTMLESELQFRVRTDRLIVYQLDHELII